MSKIILNLVYLLFYELLSDSFRNNLVYFSSWFSEQFDANFPKICSKELQLPMHSKVVTGDSTIKVIGGTISKT